MPDLRHLPNGFIHPQKMKVVQKWLSSIRGFKKRRTIYEVALDRDASVSALHHAALYQTSPGLFSQRVFLDFEGWTIVLRSARAGTRPMIEFRGVMEITGESSTRITGRYQIPSMNPEARFCFLGLGCLAAVMFYLQNAASSERLLAACFPLLFFSILVLIRSLAPVLDVSPSPFIEDFLLKTLPIQKIKTTPSASP